jgi:GDPmannose 4,6-dehydratase
MTKRAVIIGSKGQDGTLLTDLLLGNGYEVIGIDVGRVTDSSGVQRETVDIGQAQAVDIFVAEVKPDEVYYLAAYHHSSQDAEIQPRELLEHSYAVNVRGLVNVLEAIRIRSLRTRVFYASSSLVFGTPAEAVQTELTPLAPQCIYGISKTAGMQLCRSYAAKYGIFASVGILYNHESHLRTGNFLSQKIVTAARRIKQGQQSELILGDLSAQADWGYAPDYVDAMWRILQLDTPDTFIVATGTLHTVGDWVKCAFGALGLDSSLFVREDQTLITRRKAVLTGDSSKLRRMTGWVPSVSFDQMVRSMLEIE